MKNIYVEALTTEHGKKIIQQFVTLGVDTLGCTGSRSRSDYVTDRFYGVNEQGKFDVVIEKEARKGTIITLEELQKINKKQKTEKMENLKKALVTKELVVNGVNRTITVIVVSDGKNIRTGYAVRLPRDEENADMAYKIALGRALKEKTNLTPDMTLGNGMDKKYILYAIAEEIIRNIDRGLVVIKGIK